MEVTHLILPQGRVDHQTVFACDDVDLLRAWHRSAYDIRDDVAGQLEGRDLTNTADAGWRRKVVGKIAVCGMVMRWAERRLVELGHDRPLTRKRNTAEQVSRLQATIADLRDELADLRGGI